MLRVIPLFLPYSSPCCRACSFEIAAHIVTGEHEFGLHYQFMDKIITTEEVSCAQLASGGPTLPSRTDAETEAFMSEAFARQVLINRHWDERIQRGASEWVQYYQCRDGMPQDMFMIPSALQDRIIALTAEQHRLRAIATDGLYKQFLDADRERELLFAEIDRQKRSLTDAEKVSVREAHIQAHRDGLRCDCLSVRLGPVDR